MARSQPEVEGGWKFPEESHQLTHGQEVEVVLPNGARSKATFSIDVCRSFFASLITGKLVNIKYWRLPPEKKQHFEPPSQFAQQRVAQLWYKHSTEHIEMIPELAIEIAHLIDMYREALIWCSGSVDFGVGGSAHDDWVKLCEPLLRDE